MAFTTHKSIRIKPVYTQDGNGKKVFTYVMYLGTKIRKYRNLFNILFQSVKVATLRQLYHGHLILTKINVHFLFPCAHFSLKDLKLTRNTNLTG